MPSFRQAVPYLIASFAFAMTSSVTNNTVVCANDFEFTTRRETSKFSKKKNQAPRGCTYHNFVGSSKYVNCRGIETEIKIECGDEDAHDTTRMCKVTEHPWNDEQKEGDTEAAAAATACAVHGSFDPSTHITTDSATGFCHLKFLPLFNSCDADADVDADGSPSGVVGMKVEIHNDRNTENHNGDNSGMLLRFSRTGGTVYYNDDDPRETVPLHGIIPAHRKLQSTCGDDSCETSTGTYDSSKDYCYRCFTFERCVETYWKSYYEYCWNSQNQCPPKCSVVGVYAEISQGAWYGVDPKEDGTCGEPCSESSAGGSQCDIEKQYDSGEYMSKAFKGFVYGTVTTVYDPQFFFCFEDTDNPGKYCWYPTYHLPYGNWEGRSDRAYDDCGSKCTKFDDGEKHSDGIN